MDSSDVEFFEGTEKLLEIWFGSSKPCDNGSDLRIISRERWGNLLQHVQCEIISETKCHGMTAYVLSESSMFITARRFILKTCGTTTLLNAVKPLLTLVKEETDLDIVEDMFYSRKKFKRPELQHHIHQTFEHEIYLLDELFEDGSAYALGKLNRECWYLYTLDSVGVLQADQTLELLMEDLNLDIMDIFSQGGSTCAKEATEKSGIVDICSDAVIDDFLFDPCGYSMNGILPDGKYITIHITPEPHCSYVSFESNVPQTSYRTFIQKLLKIFKPGKFLMTVFANKASIARNLHMELTEHNYVDGYNKTDHQLCQFKNYNLTYTHYVAKSLPTPPAAPPH